MMNKLIFFDFGILLIRNNYVTCLIFIFSTLDIDYPG